MSLGKKASGLGSAFSIDEMTSKRNSWKILAMVLLNRLKEHLEQSGLLPERQCRFRKNRGTIDMIFTARQL